MIAATSVAAEAIGMSHRIGSVEIGKQADLLVVRYDPLVTASVLSDPSQIHMVFCDGRLTVLDGQFVW